MAEKAAHNRFMGFLYACAHWFAWVVIAVLILITFAIVSLQTGLADGLISNYAQQSFQNIVGQQNAARVDRTVLRLTLDGRLAVEARDVDLTNSSIADNKPNSENTAVPDAPQFQIQVAKAQLKLDPWDLIQGQANISAVEVSDVNIVYKAASERDQTAVQQVVIPQLDAVEIFIEALFQAIERLETQPAVRNAGEVKLKNISIDHPALMRFGGLIINEIDVEKQNGFVASLTGSATLGEQKIDLSIQQKVVDERKVLIANLSEIELDAVTNETNPEYRSGLKTIFTSQLELRRATEALNPELNIDIQLAAGTLKMGGEDTELKKSQLSIAYDADKKSVELVSSEINIANSQFPLSGGVINGENFEGGPESGLIFDFIIDDGYLAPKDTTEAAAEFSAKVFGHFDPIKRELVAEELLITTGPDFAAGNAVIKYSEVPGESPEMNYSLNVPRMKTAVIKQFWPYWLGRGTRIWAKNSIFGGEISDLKLWFHVDAGRFSSPIRPIKHTEEDYQVDYEFKNARINIVGDIPPVRNAFGRMILRGEEVSVKIDKGVSYFPSDRKMDIVGGEVLIKNTNDEPLMADIDIQLSGWADAAAELISFKPIDALEEVGIKPDGISGLVDARVKATFGLIDDQNPPDPVWEVKLDLNGVDLVEPIDGYILTNVNGTMEVDPEKAVLQAKMKADGIDVSANIIEPIGDSGVGTEYKITGIVDEADRAKLDLGLDDIVFGNTSFAITRLTEKQDQVELNLKNSKVVAPGTGWIKSKGIAAKATFQLTQNGDDTNIDDFRFVGKGFSAKGDVILDKEGLKSASFSNVKLAPKDDYNFKLNRKPGGFTIKVSGKSFDMRPLITQIKANSVQARTISKSEASFDLTGAVDTVFGFGGENVTKANMRYVEEHAIPLLAEFTGRTKSGGSVAARLKGDTKTERITVASDDSGSFWRFFDIYAYVQGGSLDLEMTKTGKAPYKGEVLIRKFKVIGDERLKTLVSTRANAKERSLNEALKGRLDVSRVSFNLASITVEMDNGIMFINDGIVRGAQIGAAFNGMLYDQDDNTDMAGTFMPAYALNRFFGEIPVLGALLGNGKDKALLGITFRVSGNSDNPRIQVNPLSVVAPGIFRNIFEFRR